jgi:hypothetical protein
MGDIIGRGQQAIPVSAEKSAAIRARLIRDIEILQEVDLQPG